MSSPNPKQQQSIRDHIKEEYIRCLKDPVFFMKNYCYIQTQNQGKILFPVFDYQERAVREIMANRMSIVLKSRQIGITTTISCYAVWLALFNPGKNTLIVSTKKETAQDIINKCKLVYENLPVWLRGKGAPKVYNTTEIKLTNDSIIKAVASSKDAGRSLSASLLIIDEAAHIDLANEIWTSAQPTLTTAKDGSGILISTPNGMGNFFADIWEQSVNGENNFHRIELDWRVHPLRNEAWKKNEIAGLGSELRFRQEHEAKFLGSGNTVIDEDVVEHFLKTYKKNPIYKFGFDGNIWIWEEPDHTNKNSYMVVADVARGDGNDFSAFHVIDLERCIQVAEYVGKIEPNIFAQILVEVATKYKDALLVVENAQQGYAVIQSIINRDYKNLFYMIDDLKYVDSERQYKSNLWAQEKKAEAGFTTSLRTRPLMIGKLQEYIQSNAPKFDIKGNPVPVDVDKNEGIIIQSVRTLNQLRTFIWNKGRAEAANGKNDDLVMSLAIGLWVRDTALEIHKKNMYLARTALDGMKKGESENVIIFPKNLTADPYKVEINGHESMNLREWL